MKSRTTGGGVTDATMEVEPDGDAAECAICWGDTASDEFAVLPCCTAPVGSSMRYCTRCIEIICEEAPGGVGRCPTCRAWLKKREGGGGFVAADEVELCNLCNQPRQIVHRANGNTKVCDACYIGAHQQLRYECQGCRNIVRIPHPMYRYQPTATEFGNNSWFCRKGFDGRGCDDFKFWRVCASDAHLVPAEDAPEGWGRREEFLARVREQRRREMRGEVAPGGRGADGAAPVGRPLDRLLARFLDSPLLLVVLAAALWCLGGR